MEAQRALSVRQVLRGLKYPAEKWQILTQAELYGADVETRAGLRALPVRRYRDSADVSAALAAEGSSPTGSVSP